MVVKAKGISFCLAFYVTFVCMGIKNDTLGTNCVPSLLLLQKWWIKLFFRFLGRQGMKKKSTKMTHLNNSSNFRQNPGCPDFPSENIPEMFL